MWKNKIIISTIIITTMILFGSGCKSELPEEEVTSARYACIDMLKKVPINCEYFGFYDVITLRDDPDLGEMYKVWYERNVDFLEERYGIESQKIEYLAESETLTIIQTDYDIDALRDRLTNNFYLDTGYEDTEVWKSPKNFYGSFILLEGFIIIAGNLDDIDDYMRVATGEEPSMHDKNTADLLKRLPDGVVTRILHDTYPLGNLIYGYSVKKENSNNFWWTHVYKFESTEAANNAMDSEYFQGIMDSFANAESELQKRGGLYQISNFSLEQSREFIEWSVLVSKPYMISLLFYG